MFFLSGVCGMQCKAVTDETVGRMASMMTGQTRQTGQTAHALVSEPLFKAHTAGSNTPGHRNTHFASDDRFVVIFLGELYRYHHDGQDMDTIAGFSHGVSGSDPGNSLIHLPGKNHARLILDQLRQHHRNRYLHGLGDQDTAIPILPDDILNRIDGIFIIVIFDRDWQRVHFISDRLGLRYFYFHKQPGRLWWATEPKAFLPCPGFSPRLSGEALDDFFHFNFIRGDKALLENVDLMPAGVVRTYDIREDRISDHTYWRWKHESPVSSRPDEIAEHLAALLRQSVARRMSTLNVTEMQNSRQTDSSRKLSVSASSRVGLGLGGGLDSRALLAAVTDPAGMYTFTFGRADSPEIRVARTVAQKAGADFNFLEINEENWLEKRLQGIWWTDGQFNLVDMHGIEVMGTVTRNIDIQLNGGVRSFLGGLASSAGQGAYWLERLRRFQRQGTLIDDKFLVTRLPFYDYEMLDFLKTVPEELLRDNRMYHLMLIRQFPDLFRGIPYSNTGYPLDARFQSLRHFIFRVRRRLGLINYMFHDYPKWIPHQIAVFRHFLEQGDPRLHDLGYRDETRRLLDKHQKLTLAECTDLCRLLTLEVYLRLVEDPEKRDIFTEIPAVR